MGNGYFTGRQNKYFTLRAITRFNEPQSVAYRWYIMIISCGESIDLRRDSWRLYIRLTLFEPDDSVHLREKATSRTRGHLSLLILRRDSELLLQYKYTENAETKQENQ